MQDWPLHGSAAVLLGGPCNLQSPPLLCGSYSPGKNLQLSSLWGPLHSNYQSVESGLSGIQAKTSSHGEGLKEWSRDAEADERM